MQGLPPDVVARPEVPQAQALAVGAWPAASSGKTPPDPDPTRSDRHAGLYLLASMLLMIGLGVYCRLQMLDSAAIGADSLSPYLKAVLVASGRRLLPQGPFPESGYIVAWTFLPYLVLADSLRMAFALRFILNAWIVVPLMGAVWSLGRGRARLLPTLVTGAVVALSPGLADTLLTGYQTFDAPLYASIPCISSLFLLFRGVHLPGVSRWALWGLIPFLPVIAMLHPFATVYALAAIPVMLVWAWDELRAVQTPVSPVDGRLLSEPLAMSSSGSWWQRLAKSVRVLGPPLAGPLALGLLLAAPHLVRHLSPLLRGTAALSEHFWSIAGAPGSFESLPAVLWKAVHEEMLDREPLAHGLLLLTPLFSLGLAVALRSKARQGGVGSAGVRSEIPTLTESEAWTRGFQRVAVWGCLLPLSLVAMAEGVHYLQPYHLRLLLPAFSVLLGLNLLVLDRWWEGRLRPALPGRPLVRRLPAASVLVLVVVQFMLHRYPPPPPNRESLLVHEQLGQRIRQDGSDRPIVMSFVHLSQDLTGSPAAFMLELWTSGWSEQRFAHTPEQLEQARIYLTVTGKAPELMLARQVSAALGGTMLEDSPTLGLLLVRLEGAPSVRLWAENLCAQLAPGVPVRAGAANDYLSVLDLEYDTALVPGWFSSCKAPP